MWNYIQDSLESLYLSHHNYTLIMVKVGCPVYMAELLVDFLGGSYMKVDLSGAVNKKVETSGFVLKVILGWSPCVLGSCILQIACVNMSKLG